MRLTPVPVVRLLRDLWAMPRDMGRFHAYVQKIQQGPDGEIFAPIVAANPMAKEHMVAYADALLALDADRVLSEACAEAERRLARSALATRVSLTPVDDVGGAWSDRDLMEFEMRFGSKRPKKDYGYVTAVVYASETPTAAMVRERVLAAVYRAAWSARFGYPEKVRDLMAREGPALRFAGATGPAAPDLAAARTALAPHLDATLHATRYAAMLGDEAARRVGHKPLGLSGQAGIAVALADAWARERTPEDDLR